MQGIREFVDATGLHEYVSDTGLDLPTLANTPPLSDSDDVDAVTPDPSDSVLSTPSGLLPPPPAADADLLRMEAEHRLSMLHMRHEREVGELRAAAAQEQRVLRREMRRRDKAIAQAA